jgi:SAM-dependent methyltransferase
MHFLRGKYIIGIGGYMDFALLKNEKLEPRKKAMNMAFEDTKPETLEWAKKAQTLQYEMAKGLIREKDLVLKMDAWNEAKDEVRGSLPGCIINIEISFMRVLKAKVPYGVCGNIRALPFKSNLFDVVLDLSTIDHQMCMELPILEYYRVLKKDGVLLLCTWTYSRPSATLVTQTANDQLIFHREWLSKPLYTLFDEVDRRVLIGSQTAEDVFFTGPFKGSGVCLEAYTCRGTGKIDIPKESNESCRE